MYIQNLEWIDLKEVKKRQNTEKRIVKKYISNMVEFCTCILVSISFKFVTGALQCALPGMWTLLSDYVMIQFLYLL